MFRDAIGQCLHISVHRVPFEGHRRAHDVSFDVPAGGQRGQLNFIDPGNRSLEIVFHDAMQLQALPRGDPQRGIAHFVAQIEFSQQLIAGEPAAWNFGAHHEGILFPVLASLVAIILLVNSMVLEQLDTAFSEEVILIGEFLGDFATQILAAYFKLFDGTYFGFFGHSFRGFPRSGRIWRVYRVTSLDDPAVRNQAQATRAYQHGLRCLPYSGGRGLKSVGA